MAKQISSWYFRWLSDEVNEWQNARIISDDQARAILSRYEARAFPLGTLSAFAAERIYFLAAVLFGAAVFMFVRYLWPDMSAATKLVLVCTAQALAYLAWFYFRVRYPTTLAEAVAATLVGALFGATVYTIADVYHLPVVSMDMLALWSLGAAFVVTCLDRVEPYWAYALLLAWWLVIQVDTSVPKYVVQSEGFNVECLIRVAKWFCWNFYPVTLMIVLLVPLAIWIYARRNKLLLAMALLLLVGNVFVLMNVLAYFKALGHWEIFAMLVGAAMLWLVGGLQRWQAARAYFETIGKFLAACVLLLYSFASVSSERQYTASVPALTAMSVFLILFIGGTFVLAMIWLQKRMKKWRDGEQHPLGLGDYWLAWIIILSGLAIIAVFRFGGFSSCTLKSLYDCVISPYCEVFFVVLVLSVLVQGLKWLQLLPYSVGTAGLVLWTVLRIDRSLSGLELPLRSAIAFLLCALALVVAGMLWKYRSKRQQARPTREVEDEPGEDNAASGLARRVEWLSQSRLALVLAVLGQILLVGILWVYAVYPFVFGKTILLKVRDVTPLRGKLAEIHFWKMASAVDDHFRETVNRRRRAYLILRNVGENRYDVACVTLSRPKLCVFVRSGRAFDRLVGPLWLTRHEADKLDKQAEQGKLWAECVLTSNGELRFCRLVAR